MIWLDLAGVIAVAAITGANLAERKWWRAAFFGVLTAALFLQYAVWP